MLGSTAVLEIVSAALSGIFALVIVWKSIGAYRVTERSHLLNFTAGLLCLAVSYAWLIPIIATLPLGDVGRTPRIVMELLGFALVASSYLTRERSGSLWLLLLTAAAVAMATVSVYALPPFSDDTLLGTTHLVELALMIFVVAQVTRSYARNVTPGGLFVFWGFGLFAVSQYTWAIWSYLPDNSLAEVAMTVRLLALVSLIYGLEK